MVDSSRSNGHSEGGAPFGIHQPDPRYSIGFIPENGGSLGPGFLDEERDQRRCVKVRDQRR
jgi:hypothetical protein